jgi:hypothetical protein
MRFEDNKTRAGMIAGGGKRGQVLCLLKWKYLLFVQFLRIGKCSATFSGGRQILSLQA